MESDRKKWNEKFRSEEWVLGRNPSPYLAEHIEFIKRLCPGRFAFDAACGEGRNSIFLARHGFDATGVDIAEAGIEKAVRRMREEGLDITFVRADLETYVFKRKYDLIINFNFLLRDLIPRLVDALSPRGVLVFDTILDTPALSGVHNKAFLLQPGELYGIFRSYPGSIHFHEEHPEDASPTAKLIFHKN